MFLLTRPSPARLDAILEPCRKATPLYPGIGGTRTGDIPAGFHLDSYSVELGRGEAVWGRALEGVRAWVAHAGAGATVHPAAAPIVEGETVLVVMKVAVLHVVAPCRIVYVVDEPGRFGFAYGTLPGHPEQGEESFIVSVGSDGQARFDVTAFSRPVEPLAKLGSPVSRIVQRRVTNAYMTSLRSFVSA